MMMLLEFAGVCFPAEITGVDSFNYEIHMVWWHMIKMRIRSLIMSSFVNDHIWGELNIRNVLRRSLCGSWLSICCWLFSSSLNCSLRSTLLSCSVMFSDFGIPNDAILGSSLLNAIALGLFGSKTLCWMCAHGSWRASVLNESNHGTIALRIEGVVWPSRKCIRLLILFRISN